MSRVYPPGHNDEKAMLLSFLDYYRETMVMKIEGLDEQQARWRPAEQANSLLVLIQHLSGVERFWFQNVITGRDLERHRDSEFEPVESVSVAEAVAGYRAECAKSHEVMKDVASLDAPCKGESGYSVRWVLMHMLEETARHAGHADITREMIDGTVGD